MSLALIKCQVLGLGLEAQVLGLGLGLEAQVLGLGLGLETQVLGLGLEPQVLVNITDPTTKTCFKFPRIDNCLMATK